MIVINENIKPSLLSKYIIGSNSAIELNCIAVCSNFIKYCKDNNIRIKCKDKKLKVLLTDLGCRIY